MNVLIDMPKAPVRPKKIKLTAHDCSLAEIFTDVNFPFRPFPRLLYKIPRFPGRVVSGRPVCYECRRNIWSTNTECDTEYRMQHKEEVHSKPQHKRQQNFYVYELETLVVGGFHESPSLHLCLSLCNVIMTTLKRRMQHKQLQGLCTKIVNDAVNNTVRLKERIS